MTYQLSVQQIQTVCLFELTWGRGQRLRSQVPYPTQLTTLYQQWQRAYLSFYKRALRGRIGAVGQVTAVEPDLHSQLVQAEARLLSEFHRWLRQGDLADIRKTLTLAAREQPIDLFLTCNPLAIARLPWETWEIGTEYGETPIRIARSPNTIRIAPSALPQTRRKTRVLVILGDETGLNFAGDRRALQSLKSLVDLTFVGWTPGQDPVALKTAICKAIADPIGWDVLLFAGHSNEADVVAGHIYVAPQTALSIWELQPYLQTAQANGLQFALFNSCSGLTIADALIELGLSQVAIMREPIHNQVAHHFLVAFLQALAQYRDVQDALQDAGRQLKLEQHLTYPSAYLVPSLFRHPDSTPFCIQPKGWRRELRRWLPGKRQAIALSTIFLLSLIPGVQNTLLSGRLLTQAIYRHLTGQLPTAPPEVVLIQVDDASRRQAPELLDVSPIDQSYLANLIDRLVDHGATVIGVDYLLDLSPTEQSPRLAATVRQAVDDANTWFGFAAVLENGRETGVNPEAAIIDSAWAMEGYTNAPRWFMTFPWQQPPCQTTCPFAYVLALAAQQQRTADTPTPDLSRQTDLRADLIQAALDADDPEVQVLAQRRLSLLSVLSAQVGGRSLRPILDFSLPPDRVFRRVPAHALLEDSLDEATATAIAAASVVLIGSLIYTDDRVDHRWSELSPHPPAIAYWRRWGRDDRSQPTFAGVEGIAYQVHHHLQSHLVMPIPALWMVGVAALVGPPLSLYGLMRLHDRWRGIGVLTGITGGLGLVSLQTAIAAGILIPWLLPCTVFWIYGLPTLWRTSK